MKTRFVNIIIPAMDTQLEARIKKGVLNSLNVTFGRFGFISKWHDPIMLKVPKHKYTHI